MSDKVIFSSACNLFLRGLLARDLHYLSLYKTEMSVHWFVCLSVHHVLERGGGADEGDGEGGQEGGGGAMRRGAMRRGAMGRVGAAEGDGEGGQEGGGATGRVGAAKGDGEGGQEGGGGGGGAMERGISQIECQSGRTFPKQLRVTQLVSHVFFIMSTDYSKMYYEMLEKLEELLKKHPGLIYTGKCTCTIRIKYRYTKLFFVSS